MFAIFVAMPEDLTYGNHQITETSQKILVALDEHGEMSSGELADATDKKHNNSVTKPVRETLEPAGLVSREKRDHPGPMDKTVHSLTGEGELFVEDYREQLQKPTSVEDVSEEVNSLRDELNGLCDDLDGLESRIQSIEGKDGRVTRIIGEIEDALHSAQAAKRRAKSIEHQVDTAIEAKRLSRKYAKEAEEHREAAEGALARVEKERERTMSQIGNRVGKNEGRVRELEAELEETDDAIEEMKMELADKSTIIENVGPRLGQIEEQVDDQEQIYNEISQLEDRVEELEEKQEKSLISKLIPSL